MTDRLTQEARSRNMSRIRSKNTKPEVLVRKFLFSRGIRFRLHSLTLPGKPDIVLPKYNTVIFVNGCFWHGHEGCKYFVMSKTRTEYWKQKIEKTVDRDRAAIESLNKQGWHSIIVLECELKPAERIESLDSICKALTK